MNLALLSFLFGAAFFSATAKDMVSKKGGKSKGRKVKVKCKDMIHSVKGFLNEVIYPNAAQYAVSGTLPPQFADNVAGRVNPVGRFTGETNTLEYFYALALGDFVARSAQGLPPTNAVLAIDFRYVTCDAKNRIATFSTDFFFGDPSVETDPSQIPFQDSIRGIGAVRFNRKEKICGYELTLDRLGITEGPKNYRETRENQDNFPQIQSGAIQQLCTGIQSLCTGDNKQYDDFDDCINFMTESIPFGDWDNADQDNVICRQLHLLLVPFRPDVHCKHTGKDGGQKCVDKSYTEVNEQDYLFLGGEC